MPLLIHRKLEPGDEAIAKAKSGIHIKPENKDKFTATKKATGKSTEALTHSKNKKTKMRAVFGQNAKKWAKKRMCGGLLHKKPVIARNVSTNIGRVPSGANQLGRPTNKNRVGTTKANVGKPQPPTKR
jgi:hypothetical protein